MRIASLAEVKAKLSAFLDEAEATGPVVITRNGRAVAILVAPLDDDDLERLLLSRSPRFRALLSKSRASIHSGKGIAHAEFWKTTAQQPLASEGRERASSSKPKSRPSAHRG